MLFECHHEGIDFIGYSLFESRNGAYSKNILASNEDIEAMIAGYIPRDTLIAVREDLTAILADTLAGHYEGFLGVDQMICQAAVKESVLSEKGFPRATRGGAGGYLVNRGQ